MTVSSSTNKVSYSGNGSLTTFAYSFKIFDQGDLTVILRAADGTETVQTITTHYTVSGVGSASGGNVVFGSAPASGVTVVIIREQPLTQGLDLVANDPFPAESLEEALDKVVFMTQKHEEELSRAIKASRTNTLTGSEFTISATDRANKLFSFDSSGNLSIAQELGTFRGDWAASTAYNPRDLVKDTSTNNIFLVNAAHTSSGSQPLTTNANSAKYDLIVDAAAATTSATNAAASATTATTKASEAATSATNAATSETNAATSATNAATSETNAATSATNAATSETNAGTSETNAASSATSAASSATTATTKASEASTSATNAASSATSASSSATTATTKAGEAATSATAAASSATGAATSATNAGTSETNAASSATAAASSATSAATSATNAAASYDSFDDRYLGAKSSQPSVDNDGDALITGALYFDTTGNLMKVYTGSSWVNAGSSVNGTSERQTYTATAGQTAFNVTYDVGFVDVYLNGVKQLSGTDFTATNGTSITLASGATVGDIVDIVAFGSFNVANTLTQTQSDARYLLESNNLSDLTNAATARTNLAVVGTAHTGDVDITGELIVDSYNETYVAVTSSSNATTIDSEAGNAFSHTLSENTTFTFSNPPASGTAYGFALRLVQDASASGYTVTWPTSVDWPSATAPTLTATASAVDWFVFNTVDGGTTWYGFTAGQALG